MDANETVLNQQLNRFAGSLTSSDVYQSYSASYAWISNQTAHIGLGLILTGIAIAFFPKLGHWPWLILPLVLYPFKELVDVMRARGAPQKAFAIPKEELTIDTAADISFVTVGISAAMLLPAGWWGGLLVLLFAGAVLWYFVPKFLPIKRAFDKSALPYFFRLANYEAQFGEADVQTIHSLLKGVVDESSSIVHLVLFGPGQSGKTTLAVGVGSELTAREARVRYISSNKYLNREANPQASLRSQPWLVDECQLLIVDDIQDALSLSQRPPYVRASVWVTDDLAIAEQLKKTLQSQWSGENDHIHLIDVQSLNYKPAQ
jgi:hypothetical protein